VRDTLVALDGLRGSRGRAPSPRGRGCRAARPCALRGGIARIGERRGITLGLASLSDERRGFRLTALARHCVSAVLPRVRVRPRVLSLPFERRVPLACHHDLTLAVDGVAAHVIERWCRDEGRDLGILEPRTDSVTAVQRFGSDLAWNVPLPLPVRGWRVRRARSVHAKGLPHELEPIRRARGGISRRPHACCRRLRSDRCTFATPGVQRSARTQRSPTHMGRLACCPVRHAPCDAPGHDLPRPHHPHRVRLDVPARHRLRRPCRTWCCATTSMVRSPTRCGSSTTARSR
jgi:hypothetical protein